MVVFPFDPFVFLACAYVLEDAMPCSLAAFLTELSLFFAVCIFHGCVVWVALWFIFSLRVLLVFDFVREAPPSLKRGVNLIPLEISLRIFSHDDKWARRPVGE